MADRKRSNISDNDEELLRRSARRPKPIKNVDLDYDYDYDIIQYTSTDDSHFANSRGMNKSGHYVVPEPVAFEEVLTVQELNEVDAFIYGDDMFEYADVHCQRGRANYFRTATGSMGPFLNTNLFSIPNKNGTVLRNLVKLQKENLAEMNSTDIINVHCKNLNSRLEHVANSYSDAWKYPPPAFVPSQSFLGSNPDNYKDFESDETAVNKVVNNLLKVVSYLHP
ncbi:Reverse transcriptase domain-containing protein [Caenorhabditis elegans]|uniref:Reverse transcriptase domain-containing protein n=2 Tax=Caenorhabditis elegans TaxID=6239 RepID=Q20803_CAEEL|nr:Reverse transcriptase domain-containing protein [Caenorhabditis elegans]CAA96661.2 Reverse transcriptase domain-containing protein [Caenorhabditis elegans]|eukprot:NP_001256369.1 Uncharacterized protein CELE_F55A11.8 [Caenorhabditis elegans]